MRKKTLALSIILPLTVIGSVYAVTTATYTTRVMQALLGGNLVINNAISATDEGFSVALNNETVTGPVSFPTTSQFVLLVPAPGVTSGHWILQFGLRTTPSTPLNSNFIVRLDFRSSAYSIGTSETVSTGSSLPPPNSGFVFVDFDVGSSLGSPASYTFSVMKA